MFFMLDKFVVVCLILNIVESRSMINEELNDGWKLFVRVHQKRFSSIKEEMIRRRIWEENLSMIREHNLRADMNIHSYYLGMNRFGDLTNEEFRREMNGYRMDLKRKFHFENQQIFVPPENFILPDSVDWRSKGYVTPIKDQGQCGSCWAFSSTGSLEGQHFAKTSKLISLSEQNLVDCSHAYLNFGCHGGVMEFAFLYIKMNGGIDTESSYPYEARDDKCRFNKNNIGANDTGFVQIKLGSEVDLQAAIATVGPISVSIDASKSSFQFYKSGIYDEPQCSTYLLDHGVLAVGYGNENGQDYYIVKNSWGTGWGNQGYIWMSRNKHNQCGIATTASYPLV